MRRVFSFILGATWLVINVAPAWAGTCTITCTPSGGAAGRPITAVDDSEAACRARCTARTASGSTPARPAACPTGQTCAASFSGGSAPVTPPSSSPPPPSSSPSTPPASPPRESVPLTLSQPIDGVREVRDLGNYIALLYRYMIGLAATAAVVMLVYGGFIYLLGSAAGEVSKGKTVIQDALIGLVLVLTSYAILSTVNPNTLSLHVPEIRTIEEIPRTGSTVTPCTVDSDCPSGQTCLQLQGRSFCSTNPLQDPNAPATRLRCLRTEQCPPLQACVDGLCRVSSTTTTCRTHSECGNGLACIPGYRCCPNEACASVTQSTCTVDANCPAGSRCFGSGPRICRPFERACGPGSAPCPEGYTCAASRPGGPGTCRFMGDISTRVTASSFRCLCHCSRSDGDGRREVPSQTSCSAANVNDPACRTACDTTCADAARAGAAGLIRMPRSQTPCARSEASPGTSSEAPPTCRSASDCPATHLCLLGRDGVNGICVERA